MNAITFRRIGLGLLLWTAMLCATAAAATAPVQLSIPSVDAEAGAMLTLPLVINEVDNLAGVKLVMQYDPTLLTFTKAAKTDNTASLMHVVNDRQPGRLIVVMAGAIGIKGKDFAILTMSFAVNPTIKTGQQTEVQILEVQLMSDTLQELASAAQNGRVDITPVAGQPGTPESAAASPPPAER